MTTIILWFYLGSATLNAQTSQPVGQYWNGRIVQAISAHRIFKKHNIESLSPAEFQFASQDMVGAALEMAHWLRMNRKSRLQVGDISLRHGGKLARHFGHQNGLDGDFAYLALRASRTGHRSRKFHNRFREIFVRS